MNDRDRRDLVEAAELGRGGAWADLGAGKGVFTLCLAAVLGPGATIWAVDRDADALVSLERSHQDLAGRGEMARVRTVAADYLDLPDLPPLDGVLMANSLHYAASLETALVRVASRLRPGGALLVVEYDTHGANPWVPYPVPFEHLASAAPVAGLTPPRLLRRVRSRYHGQVYSALARRLEQGEDRDYFRRAKGGAA